MELARDTRRERGLGLACPTPFLTLSPGPRRDRLPPSSWHELRRQGPGVLTPVCTLGACALILRQQSLCCSPSSTPRMGGRRRGGSPAQPACCSLMKSFSFELGLEVAFKPDSPGSNIGRPKITLICRWPRPSSRESSLLCHGCPEQVLATSHYLPHSRKDERDRTCSKPGLVPGALTPHFSPWGSSGKGPAVAAPRPLAHSSGPLWPRLCAAFLLE